MLKQILEQIGRIHIGCEKRDEKVEKLTEAVTTLTGSFEKHAINEEAAQREYVSALGDLKRGFPLHPKSGERDPSYHAEWHEDDIDKAKDRKELRGKILVAVVVACLMALLGAAGTMLMLGAQVEMKRVVHEAPK